MENKLNFELSYYHMKIKMDQWEPDKTINPFTNRKINKNSNTYKKVKNIEYIYQIRK